MAHKALIAALSLFAAGPVWATQPPPLPRIAVPSGIYVDGQPIYCMRVEPVTGSRIETIQCWPLEMWVEAGVDLDKDWAGNGVIERGAVTPLG
jgi:hypothetical protein